MHLKPSESAFAKRRILNYLIAFESILLIGLTGIAIQVRHVGEDILFTNDTKVFTLLVAFPIIWLCCLSLFGAWDITILDNHIDGYQRLMKSSFMTFLGFSSASYIFKIQISRFVILFSLVGGTILHLLLRWIFLRVFDLRMRKISSSDRWLVLTKYGKEDSEVQEFADRNESMVTYFKSYNDVQEFNEWIEEITSRINSDKCSKVLLATVEDFNDTQLQYVVWTVQQTEAELVVYDKLGLTNAQNQVKHYAEYNWMGILAPRINDSQRVVKRFFDLVLVIPSIIFLVPIFLLISICIRIDSRGNLLYTQTRIGQNGKVFLFPKFRTMQPGSDAKRLEFLGRPDKDMAIRYKNDPRITRFGRFLRRYSLDELPQLWCVLKGSMSLVGPRPILPEEEIQLGEFQFRRHIAKPGLTGIWQVSGRKDTSWEERMAFDIKYVQEWSMALDLILIARTFKAMISGHGSY